MNSSIESQKIKNIIFDLGGVIFNVDYNLTLEAFRQSGADNFDKIYSQLRQTSLFDDLETGKITPDIFRQILNKKLNLDLNSSQIDSSWNKMLLDLPIERLKMLKKLSGKFRTFLLSNTNAIHLPEVKKIIFNSLHIDSLNDYFEKEYYSHLIGLRKPDIRVFELIINENDLEKEATLFVDDSPQHIEGAKKAGLHTLFITREIGILDFFKNWI